ncbi:MULTISPECIES: hypothetical protein [unclassified Streptomyces]|uniref:hypothetical protein n=1 Tax=unclassified Streptomyces TaxID=2593676 RepID=UPI003D8CB338
MRRLHIDGADGVDGPRQLVLCSFVKPFYLRHAEGLLDREARILTTVHRILQRYSPGVCGTGSGSARINRRSIDRLAVTVSTRARRVPAGPPASAPSVGAPPAS